MIILFSVYHYINRKESKKLKLNENTFLTPRSHEVSFLYPKLKSKVMKWAKNMRPVRIGRSKIKHQLHANRP